MSGDANPLDVGGSLADMHTHVDTTYQTQQRDMFASGLAAQIGVNALGVWLAIKSHADFATGEAYPGVRRLMVLTGLASPTVQKALATLKEAHMLRVSRVVGQRHYYIARERMAVRVGSRVLCTIVLDYVPNSMRQRLARLKAASEGDLEAQDVWAEVEVLPGTGLEWDPQAKTLKGKMRADEVPPITPVTQADNARAVEARAKLKLLADEMRARTAGARQRQGLVRETRSGAAGAQ